MRLLHKDLTPLRAAATVTIDADAENVRGYFITQGSGQAMVYLRKEQEAEAVMANPEISPNEVGHIAQEAALNGIPIYDQAVIILSMAHQWAQISPVIETLRLAAKEAVSAATNPAEIEAATNIDWSPVLAYAA